jgi:hypothetical protein
LSPYDEDDDDDDEEEEEEDEEDESEWETDNDDDDTAAITAFPGGLQPRDPVRLRGLLGGGLHSFPFQLNLSSSDH